MTYEEAEARREELYNSLTNLNKRIDVLNETRASVRQMIKDLEVEVAALVELKLVRATPSGLQ